MDGPIEYLPKTIRKWRLVMNYLNEVESRKRLKR